jgi:hypothetical protein
MDLKTLEIETKKVLQKLASEGGRVIIINGLSGVAATYVNGNRNEPVLYGHEEFDFAQQSQFLSIVSKDGPSTTYVITAARSAPKSESRTSSKTEAMAK